MKDKLQKKEIADILGLSRSTIRYYEQLGLINPSINENKYRDYGIEELKLLSQITFLRSLNISIETIKSVLVEKDEINIHELLENKKIELLDQIKFMKDNISKTDNILGIQVGNNAKNYLIKELPERFLYKTIKVAEKTNLLDFYRRNRDYFMQNSLKIGEWFISCLDLDSFEQNSIEKIKEYLLTEKKNKHLGEVEYIPKGSYACFTLSLDSKDNFIIEDIISSINLKIHKNGLCLRNQKIIIMNNDNMSFNFHEAKRELVFQVPINKQG